MGNKKNRVRARKRKFVGNQFAVESQLVQEEESTGACGETSPESASKRKLSADVPRWIVLGDSESNSDSSDSLSSNPDTDSDSDFCASPAGSEAKFPLLSTGCRLVEFENLQHLVSAFCVCNRAN